jgi:hypothetical protein
MHDERLVPMSVGWVNLVRYEMKRAMIEAIRTKEEGKDYCPLWWVGNTPIPFKMIHGGKR